MQKNINNIESNKEKWIELAEEYEVIMMEDKKKIEE
jgi:hypothetical protein